MSIPLIDLGHDRMRAELEQAFREVLDDGQFVGGRRVTELETAFAAAHRAPAAAGCGSGTDALVLALRALGIGAGDEVVVPAMTFVASAEAVVLAGATPVLADVDPTSLLLTPEAVDRVRTAATRAVMPVHLYGHVVPLSALDAWRGDGLVVVEDAAQAHLAEWSGRMVGSAGNAATFSFYPGKNLGALGDAGMVVGDEALVGEVRHLRDHGRVEKYRHDVVGVCSRLDPLQAAFLSVKLRHLTEWTAQRRTVAAQYAARLGGLLVPWEDGAVHHLLVARFAPVTGERVAAALHADGIATGRHYPLALSQQPALAPWAAPCPHAERAAAEVLSLPMHPFLSADDVDRICDLVESAVVG